METTATKARPWIKAVMIEMTPGAAVRYASGMTTEDATANMNNVVPTNSASTLCQTFATYAMIVYDGYSMKQALLSLCSFYANFYPMINFPVGATLMNDYKQCCNRI